MPNLSGALAVSMSNGREAAGLHVTVSSAHFWCPGSASAITMLQNATSTCVRRRKRRISETAKISYIMPTWRKRILPSLIVEARRTHVMPLQAALPDRGDRVDRARRPEYFLRESVSFDEDKWDLNYRSNVARPCDGRISFTDFTPSVKQYVKEFI